MPITLNCPKCHKPFRVRDESIGGRVRCPSCGSVLQVPAALSPASGFGDATAEAGENTPRPVAEDVPASSHHGAPHGVAVAPSSVPGLPVQLPGPPSIKMPGVPPASQSRPSVPVMLPTSTPKRATAPIGPTSPEEVAWLRVRGGLGMIRCAMFLLILLILAGVGHCVWIMFDFDRAMDLNKSILHREGWPLWKEVAAAYTVALAVPAALLLLFGRLKCGRAPAESHARGLALAATFFTLVGLAGGAAFAALTYFHLGDKVKLPEQTRLVALVAAVPSAVLADVFTLLYIGQIGWSVGRPRLQLGVAGFFAYAAILPAGVLIGMQFYPVYEQVRESWRVTGSPMGDPEGDLATRVTVWGAIVIAAVIMLLLRYAGIAGSARRGIRNMLGG
jgi:predicted Zn finger-like uncharacterized protein